MSLNIIREIEVDFHDSKYIQINAKQYDRGSRYILVSCNNQGTFFPMNNMQHFAFIRYKKADGNDVFNSCKITYEGKILVELTEQMLSNAGNNWGELLIVKSNSIGNIEQIPKESYNSLLENEGNIITSMTFCVNVLENVVDYESIESSYEFNALNDLILKVTSDYNYIMDNCNESEMNAKNSALAAAESEANAKNSEIEANKYYKLSKSYAIGDTGVRTNEDTDNSKYYYENTKSIAYEGLKGLFVLMGTISFSQLGGSEKQTGYTYYINEPFITDSSFKEGEGNQYPAGTLVYCTADGYWACMLYKTLNSYSDGNGNVTIDLK